MANAESARYPGAAGPGLGSYLLTNSGSLSGSLWTVVCALCVWLLYVRSSLRSAWCLCALVSLSQLARH